MNDIDTTQDTIDIRDVIERVEELRDECEKCDVDDNDYECEPPYDELTALETLLSELRGYGGDHQWEGDWYPVTLIRDRYFDEYAEQLADDSGAIDRNATWPNNCIDWERAARELQGDYSSVEYDGVTYWYR